MRQFILTALMMTVNNYNTNNMKKFHPYNGTTEKSNVANQIQTKKRHILTLIYISLIIFLPNNILAQESTILKINGERDTFSQEIESLQQINADELSSLLFNINPTAYIESENIKITADDGRLVSKIIIQDAESIEVLKTNDTRLQKVKLIQIKLKDVSELSQPLDFSTLENTNRLKYIYLQCSFNCTDTDIKSYITETAPGTVILYSNSTPL